MDHLFEELEKDYRFKEGYHTCINCGTCTAVCPAAEFSRQGANYKGEGPGVRVVHYADYLNGLLDADRPVRDLAEIVDRQTDGMRKPVAI